MGLGFVAAEEGERSKKEGGVVACGAMGLDQGAFEGMATHAPANGATRTRRAGRGHTRTSK